jgi:hypothetical protein
MSTKSRQTTAAIMGAEIRGEGARKKPTREADRAEAYSIRMEGTAARRSHPQFAQCLIGGYDWNDVAAKPASIPLEHSAGAETRRYGT